MTCPDCERETDHVSQIAFYRLGTANIGLIGCRSHIGEVCRLLNAAVSAEEKRKRGDRRP